MSHKTTPARREAFFRALGETGNQTIAAERARVSRSWVSLHRAQDPAFRARLEAVTAEAKARLRAASGVGPGSGWGSLDGEELVVRGGNGRRTQIARARLRQWTPRAEDRFLATLAATCNVKAACAEVGLTPASAYAHAKRWTGFAERWDAAVEIGYLRIEAGLIARGANLFSGEEVDPTLPGPAMTVEQALHLLHMHQHRVHGVGGRPGGYARRRTFAEVLPGIRRKMEMIRAMARVEAELPGALEADRAEWAKRREEA